MAPRPFLKWAGGKNQLIQQYLPYLPPSFKTYYEPFLGGGAVFFHLLPTQAVLSDINPELINAYCCIQNSVEQLIALLLEHQQRHSKEYYYQVRSWCGSPRHWLQPGETLKSGLNLEKAARLIYLNKTCFNGLYRENSQGEFNVPIGSYSNPKICNPDLLRSVSIALQSTKVEVRAFAAVLGAPTYEDFVYFDPPYYPLSPTSNFTAYNRYSFRQDDQIKLRDVFAALAGRGVKVMLSNSDCPLIRELYHDFKIHPVSASRVINSNTQKRGKIAEVLVTSY